MYRPNAYLPQPARLKFTAPRIWWRSVRAQIDFLELEAVEYKGFWFSTFVVNGPSDKIVELQKWVNARN
jgi:hypothetical protein